MTTIQDAIARSISHNEIVRCEFAGDVGELAAWLNDNAAGGSDAVISEEADGSVDVDDYDGDWRIRVTLTETLADIIDAVGEWIEQTADSNDMTIDEAKAACREGRFGDKGEIAAEAMYAWQYDGIVGDVVERWNAAK